MPISAVCVHQSFLCCLDDNCDDESTRIYLYNTSKQIGVNCKDSFALIIGWLILVKQYYWALTYSVLHTK